MTGYHQLASFKACGWNVQGLTINTNFSGQVNSLVRQVQCLKKSANMELLMMKRLLAFSHGKQYAACRPAGPLYNTGCIPVWSLKKPISDWSWLKCNYFLLTKTGLICFKLMLTNRVKLWIEMTTMWLELISFFFFCECFLQRWL